MSFQIEWPTFDEPTLEKIRTQITEILNQGELPDAICDRMVVAGLDFGNVAPSLQFIDIPQVSEENVEAHFKVSYSGNGSITLQTKVQVNPFWAKSAVSKRTLRHLGSLIAHQPMVVPLRIHISQLRVDGEIVLNAKKRPDKTTREEGTLSLSDPLKVVPQVAARFKADPLQSVVISSSFDDFGSVKEYLQGEVEGALRDLFVVEFPRIIDGINKLLEPPKEDNSVVFLETPN